MHQTSFRPMAPARLAPRPLGTPFLVVDLDVIEERYRALRAALPGTKILYAMKANPHPAVLRRLIGLGCGIDAASPGEVDQALGAGACPRTISFGNTIKKRDVIAEAYTRGVRSFTFDSEAELAKLMDLAPGAELVARLACDGAGAEWPLGRKFGCSPTEAGAMLLRAASAGHPVGVAFHVGSQQLETGAWDRALSSVAAATAGLTKAGHRLSCLNIGGGFPGAYERQAPPIEAYGRAIREAIERWMPEKPGRVVAEPGRYLVADAGVIEATVVLVSRRDVDRRRWVYLDIGVFGGLAECLGEAIRYRITTPHDGGPVEDSVIAGPTCDSVDILWEKTPYPLPAALKEGDRVQILATGAYTSTYSSVGFNGFAPLPVHIL